MMTPPSTVAIDAPADLVWNVFTDVEHWPDWTPSVTRLIGLDGPELAVGAALPDRSATPAEAGVDGHRDHPAQVVDLGSALPGGRTTARHEVVETASGTTVVNQELEQRGIVGAAVGLAMRA